jgi:hypothetical protein
LSFWFFFLFVDKHFFFVFLVYSSLSVFLFLCVSHYFFLLFSNQQHICPFCSDAFFSFCFLPKKFCFVRFFLFYFEYNREKQRKYPGNDIH